jgi:membrane protein implicated in regulation of membrane protease activity
MTGMDNVGVISAIITSVISTVAIYFLTQKKATQKKDTGNIYIGETFRLKEPMKLNQPIVLNVFDLPWEAILEGDEDADVGDMVEVTSANVGQLIVTKVHN